MNSNFGGHFVVRVLLFYKITYENYLRATINVLQNCFQNFSVWGKWNPLTGCSLITLYLFVKVSFYYKMHSENHEFRSKFVVNLH